MGSNEVFVGAVTSKRHEKLLDRWLDGVNSFTHPHHLVMIDTTVGSDSYARKLKRKGVDVIKYKWNTKEDHWYQAMADSKNLLRDRFLENGYTHFFSLDTDEFIPPYALTQLVEHDKDNVGYATPMWHNRPGVFRSGGYIATGNGGFTLDVYTYEEIIRRMEKEKTQLLKVHSVTNGCLLTNKRVINAIEWCTPKFPPIAVDTLWYINCEKKGFESWVDMSIMPLHLPVGWKDVPSFTEKDILGNKKMCIAHGWITNDDPKTRQIDLYEPDVRVKKHPEDKGVNNK